MRIWFLSLFFLTSVISASVSAATVFGLDAGYQYWWSDADGRLGSGDISTPFKWSSEGQQSLYLAIEHPVPILPNLLLRYNELSGNDHVDRVTVGGLDFSGKVDLNLDNYDVILYWEVLDNWVSLDLGINAKYVNGKLKGRTTDGQSDKIDITAWVPLLYVAPRFKFPTTHLSIGGELNWIDVNDYEVIDARIDLRWVPFNTPIIDVGFDLGYRFTRVDVEDLSDFDGDVDFDGPYLGLYLHF